jgi:hypothetical protein
MFRTVFGLRGQKQSVEVMLRDILRRWFFTCSVEETYVGRAKVGYKENKRIQSREGSLGSLC